MPNGENTLQATQRLHDLGQSLWLDNITRDLLDSGTLERYIDELSVTGLTSNLTAAQELFARAGRPNLFIKIPGTTAGLPAIEEAIVAGVPVNVTLLFSRGHYVAAAEAFLRGIERRIDAGLNPAVGSVASLFVSHWDAAVMGKVPAALHNRLGIAMAQWTYKAYRMLLSSPRWQRVYNAGARPQRLLWASTGTKETKGPGRLSDSWHDLMAVIASKSAALAKAS